MTRKDDRTIALAIIGLGAAGLATYIYWRTSRGLPALPSSSSPPPSAAVCTDGTVRAQTFCPDGNLQQQQLCVSGQWTTQRFQCPSVTPTVPGTTPPPPQCTDNAQCPTDFICQSGSCVPAPAAPIDIANTPMILLSPSQVNGKEFVIHYSDSHCTGHDGSMWDQKVIITDFQSILTIATEKGEAALTFGTWFCKDFMGNLFAYNGKYFSVIQSAPAGTLI